MMIEFQQWICTDKMYSEILQKKAREVACDQVLWLYGEDEQVTEAGTMSVFMLYINDQGGEVY